MMSPSVHAILLSVFDWIIQASFMAGILVVLVLILQFLLKNKLEARWKYLLWMPVVIRLLLPWAPESSLSLYNVFSLEAIPGIHKETNDSSILQRLKTEFGDKNDTATHAERAFNAEKSNSVWGSVNVPNSSHESGTEQNWWSGFKQIGFIYILMSVWLAGVLIFGAKTVYNQLRLKQALRAGCPIETPQLSALFLETKQLTGVKRNVRFVASESIPGPAVVGFRNPAIVISPSLLVTLRNDQLQYILAHEFAHIRRWDVAVNWILHIILILHWFNPFVWIAVHKTRQHQEMACDACALDRLNTPHNNAYGQTIIHVLEYFSGNHNQPGLAALSATHKQMKRRLIMIKHFQKKSYRMSILGLTLILALGSVSLVNAKESNAGASQTASVQKQKTLKVAVKNQADIAYPAGVDTEAEREQYKKEYEKARKKADKAVQSLTAEERKFIETETKRVKDLALDSGAMFVMYHKYKDLNSGLDLSYWGGMLHYKTYEDYMNKASTLEGSILQHPTNLPEGFTFSKARIEGPTEGKFNDEVRAEGKKSGKPVYTKKIEWKEAATIRIEYTNGKDTIAISKYTLDPGGSAKKGFIEDDFPEHIYPKYMFWRDDTHEYSISTSFDMSKEEKIAILKEAVKK